jgi:cyclic beta-1,2-glucan synthetase
LLWLLGLLAAVHASTSPITLVNRAVTRGVGASRLPGLELRDWRSAHLRTLVAMPVLLNSRAAVEEHVHRLEIHYLASPDQHLHFALLTDWMDAATEHAPEDDAAARHRHRRHRAAQPALRPGRRRRTLPAAAPAPRVE